MTARGAAVFSCLRLYGSRSVSTTEFQQASPVFDVPAIQDSRLDSFRSMLVS